MINYGRSLKKRAESRKVVGPYYWTPRISGSDGVGFYQSQNDLAMDALGSTCNLRLSYTNPHIGLRPSAYWCDQEGFTTLTPIVAALPHGRGFLAGWTMGEGMVASLFTHIHETEEDAAYAAHEKARMQAAEEQEAEQFAEED